MGSANAPTWSELRLNLRGEKEKQGPDLFADAEYETAEVLARYANCFRLWPTAPQRLPADIRIEVLDSSHFVSGSTHYDARLVEVFDEGSQWLEIDDSGAATDSRLAATKGRPRLVLTLSLTPP